MSDSTDKPSIPAPKSNALALALLRCGHVSKCRYTFNVEDAAKALLEYLHAFGAPEWCETVPQGLEWCETQLKAYARLQASVDDRASLLGASLDALKTVGVKLPHFPTPAQVEDAARAYADD